MRLAAISILLMIVVGGCYADPYLPLPPAPPPVPVPPDPTPPTPPPTPQDTVSRTIFDDLKVGDDAAELGGLPSPSRPPVPTDGGKTIYLWTLDEFRMDGVTPILYEVHVVDGKITFSGGW